jgi:hypothetical protein
MAKPKKAPPRPLPPPRPASPKARRPHPRGTPQAVPAESAAVAEPMLDGPVAEPMVEEPVAAPPADEPVAEPMVEEPIAQRGQPVPRVSAWATSGQVLAYLVAVGLLVVGFVDLSHPVLGQDDAPTAGLEEMTPLAFYPPVPLSADSSYVETVVLPSGDLRVTHWIYSKLQQSSITLAVPELDGLQPAHVLAGGVELAADGRVVPGAGSVDAVSQSYQVFGASSFYVTYVLAGAVERTGSVEGRALAPVISLDVSYASEGGTSTRVIEGADILALACSPVADPDATPVPCGSPEQGRWQVELSGEDRDDRVMAQLDLG